MKKILHLADVHFSKDAQELALASLRCALETGGRERIDAWAFAGDLFDRGVTNSESSGLPRLVDIIQQMLDVAPIVSISGTPTHDLPGSYRILREIRGKNPFIDLAPGSHDVINGILFLGLPEVGKEWFLAGTNGMSADEANQKVIEGVRGILFGLGAIRHQHLDLPAVMLFHGMVAGASLANGQLVNGNLSIGRDDLALVDPEIVAYYSGSVYPVSWGELDQKGCNLVEIGPDATYAACGHVHLGQRICGEEVIAGVKTTAIPFPHPPRQKFTLAWPEPAGEAVVGVQAWVCYRATKEEAAKIDTASYLNSYLLAGALPGSRVTVEIIPTETVRAAEITESHGLFDKVVIYEEASAGAFVEGRLNEIEDKACELEREAAASGIAPEGLHIRIRKLRLRGAIGTWKGLHVDEVTLDLDAYDAGLIAMVGPNGSSKTTLIENMHPYPQMLTRDGTLQQHFRLRDSLRELTFTDERTDDEYRALIQIDGANASGSCEYYLFRNGEPLTKGRKAEYEAEILRLFGSLPLFLRSAFVSQRSTKSNPDLTEATKGEKKEIFRELAGLDYLQAYADSAKEKANAIEDQIAVERAKVDVIEGQLQALPSIREDRSQKADALAIRQDALHGLELRGLSLKTAAEGLAQKVKEQELLQQKITGLEDQAAQKRQAIAAAEELIAGYQKAVQQAPEAQKVVTAWEALKEREVKENERLAEVSKERERIITEHKHENDAWQETCRSLEGQKSKLRTESARVGGDRNVLQAQIDHLTAEIGQPFKENCPTCGQLLPESKLAEVRQKLALSTQKLAELKQKHEKAGLEVAALDAKAKEIQLPPAPTAPPLPPVDQVPLQLIRKSLAALNVETSRKSLATAQEAATRTEETKKQRDLDQKTLNALVAATDELTEQLDPGLAIEHAEAREKLEAARTDYQEAAKALAALEQEIRGLDARILELEGQAKDLEERKEKIASAQADLADWEYLTRACGPDGIQALELDAMGPGIAEVANRLLSSAYGSRFQLEFRTTRLAGKGSKTKQVEDFSIWILDSEDGTEQELSTLSGGESVWIRRALYDAFGIIRDRNTGTRFLTVFADEADGALDPDAKARYVTMLQQAHQESGRRHTIVITHSPEAQEMIGQRIVMAELAKQEVAHV